MIKLDLAIKRLYLLGWEFYYVWSDCETEEQVIDANDTFSEKFVQACREYFPKLPQPTCDDLANSLFIKAANPMSPGVGYEESLVREMVTKANG